MRDLGEVRFVVENGLVEMRDRPPERNVGAEQVGERRRGRTGRGVAPGAEGHEEVPRLVERKVPVHHRGHADGGERLDRHVVASADVGGQVLVRGLEP